MSDGRDDSENRSANFQITWGGVPVPGFVVGILIAALGIPSASTVVQLSTGYRPSAHTQTERVLDNKERADGDEALGKTIGDVNSRLNRRIQRNEESISECKQYREDHKVEWGKGFSVVERNKLEISKLERSIEVLENTLFVHRDKGYHKEAGFRISRLERELEVLRAQLGGGK